MSAFIRAFPYAEILTAVRTLRWYVIVIAVSASLTLFAHVSSNGGDHRMPIDALFILASLFAAIVASRLGTTLNAETPTLPLVWTRPRDRSQLALLHIAVDLVTILAAFILAFVIIGAAVAFVIKGQITFDSPWETIAASLAADWLWYAAVLAATAWWNGRGAFASGASWGVFLGATLASQLVSLEPFRTLIYLFNYINPISYLRHASSTARASASAVAHAAVPHSLLAIAIAIVLLAIAVYTWQRKEI